MYNDTQLTEDSMYKLDQSTERAALLLVQIVQAGKINQPITQTASNCTTELKLHFKIFIFDQIL